jgi:hypothetical protein
MLSLIAILLMLFACETDVVSPDQLFSSLCGDGSCLSIGDPRLKIDSYANTFYVSDDLVFHLSTDLFRHSIVTGSETRLNPVGIKITDTEYMAIDKENQLLYFSANYSIYQIGFDGQNITRLSPADNRIYSAPALSSCGQYLTAICDGNIARYEFSTQQWVYVEAPDMVLYAVYASDEDAYYYFYKQQDYSNNNFGITKLCRLDAASLTITELMSQFYDTPPQTGAKLLFQTSSSSRYFAMQSVSPPWQDISFFWGYGPWQRFPNMLNVYDRSNAQVIDIPDSFTFSFVPDTEILLYSHLKYGMADLISLDLSTGESTMIWDGFYEDISYSYSITRIYPRHDGGYLFIDAWRDRY